MIKPTILQIQKTSHFDQYLATGEKLKSHPIVCELLDLVKKVENARSSELYIPFIFIDGSSGVGKTQMAFNLMAAGRDVQFIPCVEDWLGEQPIYECYSAYSDLFFQCIESDKSKILYPNKKNAFTRLLIPYDLPLATYGFIMALLSKDHKYVGEATKKDVLKKLNEIEKPIIFLDEFPLITAGRNNVSNVEELRFMRNIFRSLKIVVILSSTNTSACNLLTSSSSSRVAEKYLWCYVLPQSCPYQLTQKLPKKFRFLKQALLSSRPLFSRKLMELISGINGSDSGLSIAKLMDRLMRDLALSIKGVKRIKNDNSGFFLNGQVALFLSASFIDTSTEINDENSLLIHRHFANLSEVNPFALYLEGGDLKTDDLKIWRPTVMFSLRDDILLFLSLMGGYQNYAIEEKATRIPFVTALDKLLKKFNAGKILLSNSRQSSKDGLKLESLLSGAIVLASHANGFEGISIPRLLGELCYELKLSQSPATLIDLPQEFFDILNTNIPFLGPPNQTWPEYIKNKGLVLGECERPGNSSMIDFKMSGGSLTGECKDYGCTLNISTIQQILHRVPSDCRAHLVLTNTLQNSYYQHEKHEKSLNSPRKKHKTAKTSKYATYHDFVYDSNHPDRVKQLGNCMIFNLIVEEGGLARLKAIPGLTLIRLNAQPKKIVIFIELRQN